MERLASLERDRKAAEVERKKVEASIKAEHEKELERVREQYAQKELERQLEAEKERLRKDGDLQEARLKQMAKIKELEDARKAAEGYLPSFLPCSYFSYCNWT
jgi:uncharacterized protein involved in exopolysaccharide biosynthesis